MATLFHQKARDTNARPSSIAHTNITVPAKQQHKVRNMCFDGASGYQKPSLQCQVAVNPQNSYGSALNASGNQVEFIVRRSCIQGLTENAAIVGTLTNTHGSAAVYLPAALWWRVEILSNASHIVQTLYPEDLHYNFNLLEKENCLIKRAALANSTSNLGAGSSVSTTSSINVTIPLLNSIFERNLYMPRIEDLTVRLVSQNILESGTLSTTLSNLQLVIKGREVSDLERQSLNEMYDKKFMFRVFQTYQNTISSSLSASQQYQWQLNCQGLAAALFLYVRAIGSGSAARVPLDYLEQFNLLDGSGNSLFTTLETSRQNRYHTQNYINPDNVLSITHPLHVWSFSDDIVGDIRSGKTEGYVNLTGAEALSILSSASATGSTQIQVDFSLLHIVTVDPSGNLYLAR